MTTVAKEITGSQGLICFIEARMMWLYILQIFLRGGACTKHNDPNISTGSSLETNANQLGSFSAIIRKKCQKTFADVKLH
jgi:hypothetical protein